MSDKIHLSVDASLKELLPGFLASRRADLEAMRRALRSGDLAAIRRVGHNIRAFSRLYGFEDLTALGEELQQAAAERSMLRIAHVQSRLADYLGRIEFTDG